MDIGILLGLLRTCVGSRRGESSLAARRSGATRSTPSRASRRLAEEAGKKATARLWTHSVVSRRAGLLCVFFSSAYYYKIGENLTIGTDP